MAGFGADAIAVVTGGLRRSTGTFAERLVSWGYVGDIVNSTPAAAVVDFVLTFLRRRRRGR
jgi:hypothetical protein